MAMKLSTGADNTLQSWLSLSLAMFGADSAATHFLQDKIAASVDGGLTKVIADERQLLSALMQMHVREQRATILITDDLA